MFGSNNRKTNVKLIVSFFLSIAIVTHAMPAYTGPAKVDGKITESNRKDPEKVAGKEKSPPFSSPGSSGKKPEVETFAGPPLSFETNKGQADASVKFLAHSRGGDVLLSSQELTLLLSKTKAGVKNAHSRSAKLEPPSVTTLRMKLQGGNPNPKTIGLGELPGKTNYFLGNDSSKWRTDIPNYKKVRYEAVYPGIDVIYYGNQNQVEYDFVVAPYADPNSIRMRFDDRCKLTISRNGDLLIAAGGIEVRQVRPNIYQNSGDGRIAVPGRYVLRHHEVSFEIGAYDQSKPLIIDPVLSYSSYLWGIGYDIAVDSARNMYVVGSAWGTSLTLVNPVQSTYAGDIDIYVQKFDPTGSTLLLSTYLGGSSRDDGNGYADPRIAVDPAGNIYVRGTTSSTDFPTVNAVQPTFGGGLDSYVAKIAAAGNQLIYSTYLGGSSLEEWGGIAVDQQGNAYITGGTYSTNFPTYNPLMPPRCDGNNRDVFVSVLNPTGTNFIYSTHINGGTTQGDEAGYGIAVDAAGNAYVTGRGSNTFPTTPGAYQTSGGGGFITKINPNGTALIYSTHLAGAINAGDIAIDPSGNAYITGYTSSAGLPTVNAFQPNFSGATDVFVAKLDSTGSSLLYASYLGGSGSEYSGAIAVDQDGYAYLTGTTMGGFPLVNPTQSTMGGGGGYPDAFVTKVDVSGTSLVFSTYLGGTGQEDGRGIAADSDGNAYVTGSTNATTDFPKVNPFQSTGPGGFLSKYTGLKTYKITGHITANSAGFAGVTVNLSGGQSRTTQTDANGDYIFNNLPSAANYTVTPTKAGYLFSPTNRSFTNLSGNQVADFAAVFYSVSGRVTDSLGAGLNAVTLTLNGTQTGTTQTDPDGYYTFPTVAASGNYTLTPSKPDPILTYSFVPLSQTINGLNANQTINFSSSNSIVSALNSTADAYVQDGTGANTNFGPATTLKTETDSKTNNSKNFDSYLKFDVSGVAGNITSVKLRIFASSSTAAGATTGVYSLVTTTSVWSETGITWNNKPQRNTSVLTGATTTISSTTAASYDLDVTNFVKGEKSAGRDAVTLVLHNTTSSTVFVTLNSREAAANKPQLIVTTSTSQNTGPSVALTSPSSGTPFTAPANITVSASASDSDGISKVEFYAGTTRIGTATAAPYQITWGSVSAGSYSLTAVATDNLSVTTVSAPVAISVSVPNIAPSVTLDSPLGGTTFSAGSNIPLVATALDGDGTISKVEFFAGASLVGTATVPSSGAVYSVTWSNVNSGAYALTAKATDNLNGTITSSIVNINVVSQTGLSSTADAYVRDGASAATNFGTATELQTQVSSVGANRETYLKFDITTVAVTSIVNAKLRLYGRLSDTSGTNVPVAVYPVLISAPDWNESGNGSITWNNKPATGAALTSATVIDNNARWYEWNIGDYVKAEKDAGRNIIKLAIKNTAASTPYATFNSKENDNNRPQLVLWTTQARNALLVANSTTLGTGDNAVKTRLQNLGYTVTVKGSSNSNAVATSDATGKAVVLISSTVTSANVLAKFRHVAVPVIIWKADLFDDHGMTGATANDFGTASGQTQLTIINATHPLAAGLSASPSVSASSSFTWGNPNANAAKIATVFGDATKFVIFGYDNTVSMTGPNLDAPARRVGFFLTDLTAGGLTAPGNSLFDAAVKWATEVVTAPVISSLTPSIGLAGTQVTINGTNFGAQQDTSVVNFNGATATPSSWSHTSIVVTVPVFATTGPVVITVKGLASNGMIFSVGATDSDGDGLPDSWELQYFGNLNQSASGDADGDGLTNLQEFQQGRNPTKSALADNGDFVNLKIYTPLLPLP